MFIKTMHVASRYYRTSIIVPTPCEQADNVKENQ